MLPRQELPLAPPPAASDRMTEELVAAAALQRRPGAMGSRAATCRGRRPSGPARADWALEVVLAGAARVPGRGEEEAPR